VNFGKPPKKVAGLAGIYFDRERGEGGWEESQPDSNDTLPIMTHIVPA
jgi:hypothetical protein